MDVAFVTPPGRFPTVVRDPGSWWECAAELSDSLLRHPLNAAWWWTVCGGDRGYSARAWLGARLPSFLRRSGASVVARSALHAFQQASTYEDETAYRMATRRIDATLAAINRGGDLYFSLDAGVKARPVSYGRSRDLLEYARARTPLSRLITSALDAVPFSADALLVDVSSSEDLLTAMIVVRVLREKGRIGYAALVDHGYENFSLRPHLPALRARGALLSVFDAIIEEKDDRDVLVPRLLAELRCGTPMRGFVRLTAAERAAAASLNTALGDTVAPPAETFAPWPILFTRVSPRRCYWARCTFCVHNLKYAAAGAPSLAEVPSAARRLRSAAEAGYRQAVLADEALSPVMLQALARAIESDGLLRDHPTFRWTCRSKLERAHDRALFNELYRAGCVEILFGLESASDRVMGLMDKQWPGARRHEVIRVLDDMTAAGIAPHVNVILGFPGEQWAEARMSVEFLVDVLAGRRGGTWTVNPFTLFPDTTVAREADRFGIAIDDGDDDMPMELQYRPTTAATAVSQEIRAATPAIARDVARRLGAPAAEQPGSEVAEYLYGATGHGLVMKTGSSNFMDYARYAA